MSSPPLPLVLLLDLDNTVVGDASLQVCRYETLATVPGAKHDQGALVLDLDDGLLRPHFESCMKLILAKHPTAEIFFFTAAEKKWAHVVISAIEKLTRIKFNRPVFSREYCVSENGALRKNIVQIAPIIYRRLRTKYGLTGIGQLKKQIVLIDNNHVVGAHDVHRFVKCPSYEHPVVCDVLEGVPRSKLRLHLHAIGTVLQKFGMSGAANASIGGDVPRFLAMYHAWLAELYRQSCSNGNKARRDADHFWLVIERIFRNHNIRSFSVKVVTYINKNVRG